MIEIWEWLTAGSGVRMAVLLIVAWVVGHYVYSVFSAYSL